MFQGLTFRSNELFLNLAHIFGVEDVEPGLAEEVRLGKVQNLGHGLGDVEEPTSVTAHNEQKTLGHLKNELERENAIK